MKLNHSVSILNNTNRVIANSEVNWSAVREGALFRIKEDKVFYQVGRVDKKYLIKDYIVTAPSSIDIKSNVGIDLAVGDELILSYKEYTVATIWNIMNAGSGYQAGDELSLKGGTPSIDPITGVRKNAIVKVKEVDGAGKITEIGIVSNGEYIVTPAEECDLVGGRGVDAKFEVEYKLIDNRKTVERTIDFIDVKADITHIMFNYPLPAGVAQGKLSVEKFELYLTTPYLGDTRRNVEYEVIEDFTPKLKLPLLSEGSFSTEQIVNKALTMLENEIMCLRKRLDKLEKEPSIETSNIENLKEQAFIDFVRESSFRTSSSYRPALPTEIQ